MIINLMTNFRYFEFSFGVDEQVKENVTYNIKRIIYLKTWNETLISTCIYTQKEKFKINSKLWKKIKMEITFGPMRIFIITF